MLAFWNQDDDHVLHWIVKSLADVVFEMYPWGMGSDFDVAKFGIVEKEESDRRVIGLSAAIFREVDTGVEIDVQSFLDRMQAMGALPHPWLLVRTFC